MKCDGGGVAHGLTARWDFVFGDGHTLAYVNVSAVIFASDVRGMAEFYREFLHATPIESEDSVNWVELRFGEDRLWIHAIGPEWRTESDPFSPPNSREENPIKLVFCVAFDDDLDDRIRRLGGSVIARPWGRDYCDPEGNVFSVRGEVTG
jgi:hypothetical protein